MSGNDVDVTRAPPPGDDGVWHFEPFRLDPATGVLLAGEQEIVLRPKTAAVLVELLSRAGELVPREALLEAVWPDVTVTDDSLTQCISEIRRALGMRGPDMLRTLPRRGYLLRTTARFLARPEPVAEARPAPAAPPTPPRRPLTGRLGRGAAALALLGLLLAGWLLLPGGPRRDPAQVTTVVPPRAEAPAQAAVQGAAPDRARARVLYTQGEAVMYGDGAFEWRMRHSLALFRQALAADPELADAAAQAAFAHANLLINRLSQDPEGELEAAGRMAELAMALAPQAPLSLSAHAAVLRQRGDFAAARAFYARAGAAPLQLPSRANAAFMLVLMGEPAEAVAPLRAVLMESASHPLAGTWRVYLGLAQLLGGEGDFGAAAFDLPPSQRAFMAMDLRLAHRAAALLRGGETAAARLLVASIAARRADLTIAALREEAMSAHPAYLALREAHLLRPLAEAGLPP